MAHSRTQPSQQRPAARLKAAAWQGVYCQGTPTLLEQLRRAAQAGLRAVTAVP